jgi:hypothetical protein
MPSPTCTINGGATPANVPAGSTVNGALAVPAGAQYWAIACTSTDDTNTAAAVNATLVVNVPAKTFSFTAPATLGSALIFTSTVGVSNGTVLGVGLDANGVPQASYTTTFKVNVLTAQGRQVVALNEQVESGSVGWVVAINNAIRSLGGAAGGSLPPLRRTSGGGNYTIQAGDPTDVWVDTSGGMGTTITFYASPFDGMRQRFKDNHSGGSWGAATPLTLKGNTGQKVENPNSLGTLSGAGGTQNATVPGGSLEYVWGATESAWLIV